MITTSPEKWVGRILDDFPRVQPILLSKRIPCMSTVRLTEESQSCSLPLTRVHGGCKHFFRTIHGLFKKQWTWDQLLLCLRCPRLTILKLRYLCMFFARTCVVPHRVDFLVSPPQLLFYWPQSEQHEYLEQFGVWQVFYGELVQTFSIRPN